MPIENELKFVLKNADSIQYEAMEASYECLKIDQGYVEAGTDLTVRVRKVLNREGIIRHFLQVKTDSNRGRIEVSTLISEKDFTVFWKKAKGKLFKIRYLIKSKTHDYHEDHDGHLWTEIWEMDFLKTGDNVTYFSVSEVELPEGVKEPLFEVPDVIRNNTVFRVPPGDSRFSNSRLVDVGYATELYKSLFAT